MRLDRPRGMVLRRAPSATASGLEPTRHSSVLLPLRSVTTIANSVMAISPALRTTFMTTSAAARELLWQHDGQTDDGVVGARLGGEHVDLRGAHAALHCAVSVGSGVTTMMSC